MGMWDFIAIAVVSGCLLEAYRAYTKSRRSDAPGSADVKALEQRIAALEKKLDEDLEMRTRALETIVTDSSYQIGKDIDALRS